jgi:hypothetical protein
MTDWLPIESAPTTGLVLLFAKEAGHDYFWLGSFDRFSAAGLGGAFREAHGIEGSQGALILNPAPTHWALFPETL